MRFRPLVLIFVFKKCTKIVHFLEIWCTLFIYVIIETFFILRIVLEEIYWMWIDAEQIELVGVLTTISIGEEDLVFKAKFVADDKFAKWGEPGDGYVFIFKSFKQKSIDRIVAKVEKQYLKLLKEKVDRDGILDRVSELLLTELRGFEERTRGDLEFHQLIYINEVGEEKILWQSQYFDDIYVDRFFDCYD